MQVGIISVPAVTLDGSQDPLKRGGTAGDAKMFSARHEHRVVDCGQNLPWEAPLKFADAVLTVAAWVRGDGGYKGGLCHCQGASLARQGDPALPEPPRRTKEDVEQTPLRVGTRDTYGQQPYWIEKEAWLK